MARKSQQTLVAAGTAITANGNTTPITSDNAREARFFINVSAVSGTTPGIVFKLQGYDNASATWFDIPNAALTSITTAGQYLLEVSPDIATTTGTSAKANTFFPLTSRLAYTVSGTTPSFTLSIGVGIHP